MYTLKCTFIYNLTFQVCQNTMFTMSYSAHKAGTFFRQTPKCEYLKNYDRIRHEFIKTRQNY